MDIQHEKIEAKLKALDESTNNWHSHKINIVFKATGGSYFTWSLTNIYNDMGGRIAGDQPIEQGSDIESLNDWAEQPVEKG